MTHNVVKSRNSNLASYLFDAILLSDTPFGLSAYFVSKFRVCALISR